MSPATLFGKSSLNRRRPAALFFAVLFSAALAGAQPAYDVLIQRGHVMDPKNGINRVMDIAVKSGKIARVAPSISAAEAAKVIDARGLYVTPGLVDLHVHVFAGGSGAAFAGGDFGILPDGMALRSGVTTVVDAGSSGWRNFLDFKRRIIDRDINYPMARVLAMLNIVGHGMGGSAVEQNTEDMDAQATARVAREFPQLVVGIKVAHYTGQNWIPFDRAVEAGTLAGIPVMVDFGQSTPARNYQELVLKHLRPGDISTHMYASSIPLLSPDGKLLPYLAEARKRGIFFDLGHGNKSFFWRQALPAARQGWMPDSISSDIHARSQLASMKDMTTCIGKVLTLGASLYDAVAMSTWRPAQQIKRSDLGHLTPGAAADIAVLRHEKGAFGYWDGDDLRHDGSQRVICELTLRDGKVAWDWNGISMRKFEERMPRK